jgi:hypothetical protein
MTELEVQGAAFYRNVATRRRVWTVRDAGGFPAPMTASMRRAQPFWSTRRLAELFVQSVRAYRGFEVVELEWEDFRDRWVPGLSNGMVLVGIDWTGPAITGPDAEGTWVCECVEIEIARLAREAATRPARPEPAAHLRPLSTRPAPRVR